MRPTATRPQKYKNETQNSGYPDFVHPWHEKWNRIELTHYPISPHIPWRYLPCAEKTDLVCLKASCRNFPPHKAWLPLYTPTSNNNVILLIDDSITSVGDYLSRELYTRAPGSHEYPLIILCRIARIRENFGANAFLFQHVGKRLCKIKLVHDTWHKIGVSTVICSFPRQFFQQFLFCSGMCPAMGWVSQQKRKYKNETEVRGILVVQVSPPSLKFGNEAGQQSASSLLKLYTLHNTVYNLQLLL